MAALDLWETTYLHVLSGEDAVVEWAAGSSLRPFLDKLPPELRAAIAPPMPRRCGRITRAAPDGATLLPFRRLFILARRG